MISAIFKSALPSFSYHFKNGMTAVFMQNKFITADATQIKELMEEIKEIGTAKSHHPYIFVDEEEKEIDSEALSPMELVRLKAREEARRELLAEQEAERARAMNVNNVSNTQSDAFKNSIANSHTLSEMLNAGTAPVGFTKVPNTPVAEVGVGVATHNNPMASDVLVPAATVAVNVAVDKLATLKASAKKD